MRIGAIRSETNIPIQTPTSTPETKGHLTLVPEQRQGTEQNPSPNFDAIRHRLDAEYRANQQNLGGIALLAVVLAELKEVPAAPTEVPPDPDTQLIKVVRIPSPGSKTYQAKVEEAKQQLVEQKIRKQAFLDAKAKQQAHDAAMTPFRLADTEYQNKYMEVKGTTGLGPNHERIGDLFDKTEFAESTLIIDTLARIAKDKSKFSRYLDAALEASRIARIKLLHDKEAQLFSPTTLAESIPASKANGVTVLLNIFDQLGFTSPEPAGKSTNTDIIGPLNSAYHEFMERYGDAGESDLDAQPSFGSLIIMTEQDPATKDRVFDAFQVLANSTDQLDPSYQGAIHDAEMLYRLMLLDDRIDARRFRQQD